ncbi:MAG: trehalose-phosphatase [Dehalococcoidia bacterium]|nr:trehalose-phosphatase [Dehalococcoidia bacterium]
MRYLFESWAETASRIRKARHILFLSDFDGTLTPIVERPEDAVMPEQVRGLLRSLAKNHHYTVGIISGRALLDLMIRVDVRGIIYAGNHGMEIYGKGVSFVEPVAEGMQSLLRVLHHALSIALKGIKGVIVENKGLSLSVHYRLAEEKEHQRIKDIFEHVSGPLHAGGGIKVTFGKKVYEVRPPVAWNKGKAVEWLVATRGGDRSKGDAWPIFLGDDLTDEDGFAAVKERQGLSVFVGDKAVASEADYYLPSPKEVELLLRRLTEIR